MQVLLTVASIRSHPLHNLISFGCELQIRVTFVNEFGVEEAGIDGGGIFKDFMENITRAAFDVQYGLFKVTIFYWLEFKFCEILQYVNVRLAYNYLKVVK